MKFSKKYNGSSTYVSEDRRFEIRKSHGQWEVYDMERDTLCYGVNVSNTTMKGFFITNKQTLKAAKEAVEMYLKAEA